MVERVFNRMLEAVILDLVGDNSVSILLIGSLVAVFVYEFWIRSRRRREAVEDDESRSRRNGE